jgi:DNA-binding IclR family transcriptional regulator
MTQALSTLAVLHHSFGVSAIAGPLEANEAQAHEIKKILHRRGFFDQFPSFHFRLLPKVRKTPHGFVDAVDLPSDFYIVGSAHNSELTRALREIGATVRRVTGSRACVSRVPQRMLSLVR